MNAMSFLSIYQLCKNNRSHFKYRYRIGDGLFEGFPAISVHEGFGFLAVQKPMISASFMSIFVISRLGMISSGNKATKNLVNKSFTRFEWCR